MTTPSKIERVLSALLSVATMIGVGILVESRINRTADAGFRQERIQGWTDVRPNVVTHIGESSGDSELAMFTDYECPVCRAVDSALAGPKRDGTSAISSSIIHFPLPGHPNAMNAAVALECAAAQGRASPMHRALFRNVQRFGKASWVSIAVDAGVPDTAKFAGCFERETPRKRIQEGINLGTKLKISGTPAYVIDGVLYDAAPFPEIQKALSEVSSKARTNNSR